MIIRPESADDHDGIWQINSEAFGTEAEANLINTLRQSGIPLISLVAEEDGQLIGHILFSPVTLQGDSVDAAIAGLAPMAVRPRWQRQGVGTKLVAEGLKRCRQAGYGAVVVLGHPEYYPRFGFVPSVEYDIRCAYDVPAEVFMVKELLESFLTGVCGTIDYHPAFNDS